MSASVSPLVGPVQPSATKYAGVYPAQVYSTSDPTGTGCIQMYVPQVFGTSPLRIWAPPLLPGCVVPTVGSVVWCLFQGGDPSYPTYLPNISSYAQGLIGRAIGPPTSTDCLTAGIVMAQLVLPVVQGRWYRVTGYAQATQVTVAGTPVQAWMTADDTGTLTSVYYNTSFPVNTVMLGTGVAPYTPTATRNTTFQLLVRSGAGAQRVPANICYMLVEDMGT